MNGLRAGVVILLTLGGVARAQTNFFIKSIQATTNGQVTLTWSAVPYSLYYVQIANAPGGPWSDLSFGQVTAASNTAYLTFSGDPTSFSTAGFCRIRRPIYQSVILSLVMDRSGSILPPGASTILDGAVINFINSFNETVDHAALVTFATTARTDVPMAQPFKNQILNAVLALQYSGASFTQGGLTNALVQETSITVPPGQSALKAAVLFTDGGANIVQDTLNCGGTPTLRNFGGFDPPSPDVGFFNPTNGTLLCTTIGGTPSCCPGVSSFHSASDGTMKTFLGANVVAEAKYRTLETADKMRANGIVIYSIGFGVAADQMFLQEVANDPASPIYDPTQPTGYAVFAPSTSTLSNAFQQIAARILANVGP